METHLTIWNMVKIKVYFVKEVAERNLEDYY
jgi:hypothetical protein